MSGGVDSSVTAALLVEEGYSVIGLMLRLWHMQGENCENRCCSTDAIDQARLVAHQINIPFYTLDSREAFRNTVVSTFIECSSQGLTPNPCFICNQHFRWKSLLNYADSLGIEFIATGHYARLQPTSKEAVALYRGVDNSKDQSYVLSGLNQNQLLRTILPLGKLRKSEVRQIAQRMHLPTAARADSQDLCFIGNADYRQFFARYAPQILIPGLVSNSQGTILGEHKGLALFTIGQRKGLGIFAHEPYYVLGKDTLRNILVVGKKEELGKNEMIVQNVNWVSGEPPANQFCAQVKIRYKAGLVPAQVSLKGRGQLIVHFEYPLRDITPGQMAVFYQDDLCLGGGTILSGIISPQGKP